MKYRSAIVALLISAALTNAEGQGTSTSALQDLLKLRGETAADQSQLNIKPTAVDAPVNPVEYSIGPGDVLALNIWSSLPVAHQLTVTPEGTLLIPNVGVIDVQDRTLADAKRLVAAKVGARYPTAEVTLTLVTPRKIVVQVTGAVLNEVKFEMSALQRVDNLIAAANALPGSVTDSRFFLEHVLPLRSSYSLRHILIQRRTGERLRADLLRYQVTGQGRFNPYLREGDQVYVPPKRNYAYAIGVSGAIRQPGSFEFVPGDSLTDLVAFGFGFRSIADSTKGILSRQTTGGTLEEIPVNPAAIIAGDERNIALKPGDRLFIKQRVIIPDAYFVGVDGEVMQSGQYAISLKNTKLSEVIKAAGGFLPEANIRAATLSRARVSPQSSGEEIEREQLLSSRNNLGLTDTAYYLTETALRLKGELVAVDFHRLFVEGDSTQDVTLRPFDRIYVPRKTSSVYVFGQVLSPGHVEFVEGMDYTYYIAKAAGYTTDANKSEVKIIKGGTRLWFEPKETKIEDGDFVWVPKERRYPFAYHLNMYAQVAGIIGTVATVALLINNLTK